MFNKLLKDKKQIFMVVLLIALGFIVFQMCRKPKMFYQGSPINIVEKGAAMPHDQNSSMECLETAYYTRGLEAKGVCDVQKVVNDQASWSFAD